MTPDGRTILAPLPAGIDGHFGPALRCFVLMHYHQGQSTLPRLTALLQSLGVSISKRQVQRLLTDKPDDFVSEAQDVLRAGLETSPYVTRVMGFSRDRSSDRLWRQGIDLIGDKRRRQMGEGIEDGAMFGQSEGGELLDVA